MLSVSRIDENGRNSSSGYSDWFRIALVDLFTLLFGSCVNSWLRLTANCVISMDE